MKIALIALYDAHAMGLRCLSGALKKAGHEVFVIHFKTQHVWNMSFPLEHSDHYQMMSSKMVADDKLPITWFNSDGAPWTTNELFILRRALHQLGVDLVGLSTRSVYGERMREIVDATKGFVTVAGGHDASFRPEHYFGMGVDYVCVGDGEDAIVSLANGDTDHPNIAYRSVSGGVKIEQAARPVYSDTDHFMPDMSVEHFVIEGNAIAKVDPLFRDFNFPRGVKDYYTMLGRGCMGECTFCSAGKFNRLHAQDKPRRIRDVGAVIKECIAAKELGFEKIIFLDSFFVAPKKVLGEFFEKYGKKVGLPFFAQLHPEQVLRNPALLDEAVAAGMTETVIGFQSGSEEVARNVFNRHVPFSKLIEFAKLCEGKVSVDYHFISHNPFETNGNRQETIELIKQLPKKGNNIIFMSLKAFPNTDMYWMTEGVEPVSAKEGFGFAAKCVGEFLRGRE